MKDYKKLINLKKVPSHVAIIMDGNGRWAKKRKLSRSKGHKAGAEIIEPLMDVSVELGIKAISLYAFSMENWTRPKLEIQGLWKLLEFYFTHNMEKIQEKGIRVTHSGSLKRLPGSIKRTINNAVEETKNNKIMVLNFCVNYGGQQEIVESVNTWLETRKTDEKLNIKKLEKNLYTQGLPDVDLLIRTSGEKRISNFFLWQIAYSEIVFLDVLWPDFLPENLYQSIYEYQQRDRRYGGL
jgi:undecaprenyl diphosphate synthase